MTIAKIFIRFVFFLSWASWCLIFPELISVIGNLSRRQLFNLIAEVCRSNVTHFSLAQLSQEHCVTFVFTQTDVCMAVAETTLDQYQIGIVAQSFVLSATELLFAIHGLVHKQGASRSHVPLFVPVLTH